MICFCSVNYFRPKMTNMPLNSILPFKSLPSTLPAAAPRLRSMASTTSVAESGGVRGFPTPLTPPHPSVSKEVELARAMTAAARSGAYKLSSGEVVFEDESMVVVNKPSGIYCETVLEVIASRVPLAEDGTRESSLHLANRLDRDTSGLMVITKSHKVAAKLVKAFTDHKISKTYIALCTGPAPKWDNIAISSGHGRSKFGAWRVYAASDVGRSLPGGSTVKHMTTSFEILSINGQGEFSAPKELRVDGMQTVVAEEKAGETRAGDDQILVRAYPKSGRTHQIRLHCQYLGIPIRGDAKYGGVLEWNGMPCEFHALHAESLSFDHPVTGVPVTFLTPLPSWISSHAYS